jgi:hypothetical protein
MKIALQIAQRELGEHWVDHFVQRYPKELISKWMMATDNSRHKADSGKEHSLYSDLPREKIEHYHIKVRHM